MISIDDTKAPFRYSSLARRAFEVVCKHYQGLHLQMALLPAELRTFINLHLLRQLNLTGSHLLDIDTDIKTEINKSSDHTKQKPMLLFHWSDEFGGCIYGDDRYRFSTVMDPRDRKRLLIVHSINGSDSWSIEYCPTLPRYACEWHSMKRCYRRLPCIGLNVALARFITQNPYIDYILSFSTGIVRYSDESPWLSMVVSHFEEQIARAKHTLSWLHLICTSRKISIPSANSMEMTDTWKACEPTMPFLYDV